LVQGGRKKVHTTFPDGGELVEEYDEITLELLVRKRRQRTALGKDSPWQFEVGAAAEAFNPDTSIMKESTLNPSFARKDTKPNFEWRVRNLPYPTATYSVTISQAERSIIIRTSNKKYYKKFNIPELDHLGHDLEDSALQWKHANNTLHIVYKKPPEVVKAETNDKNDLKQIKQSSGLPATAEEGCKQQ